MVPHPRLRLALLLPLVLLLSQAAPPVAAASTDFSTVFTSKANSPCPSNSRLVTYQEASANTAVICTQLAALLPNASASSLSRLGGGGTFSTRAGGLCTVNQADQTTNIPSLCLSTAPAATFASATTKQQAAQLVKNDKAMLSLVTGGGGGQDADSMANIDTSFESWAAFYNYKFQGAALDQARSNYQDNLRTIATVNSNLAIPHWLGANQFAHLSSKQFGQRPTMNASLGSTGRRLHGGEGEGGPASGGTGTEERPWNPWSAARRLQASAGASRRAAAVGSTAAAVGSTAAAPGDLPLRIDWLAEGKVTPVRNQYGGQAGNNGCGSCWAFTAVAAIESAYLISKRITTSSLPDLHLSEEQVLDCCNPKDSQAFSTVSDGCSAGSINEAILYAKANPLTTSFHIGYSSVDHAMTSGTSRACDQGESRRIAAAEPGQAVQLSEGYRLVTSQSKTAMMRALTEGPVAVYFDSAPLQLYRGGVYAGDGCTAFTNHAMLVVGYNTVDDSAPYWLIKNQFGTGWGEQGYMRVAMKDDGSGACGMYLGPSQVIPSFVPGLDTLYASPPYLSPPPAPPPAPPSLEPWPNCEPGNTNRTLSFGWTVSLQSFNLTQLTLQVQPNPDCTPAGSACCQSSLQHIQLRVQEKCYISSLLVLPLVSSPDLLELSPNWPEKTPNILDIELNGSGITPSSVKTSIAITLTVDTTFKTCSSRRAFFVKYNSDADSADQYTYAAFSNARRCCGTDFMAPVSKDPVNCQVSWPAWGPCSATCGGGMQSRSGTISQRSANGGTTCPALTQSQVCNTQACPASPRSSPPPFPPSPPPPSSPPPSPRPPPPPSPSPPPPPNKVCMMNVTYGIQPNGASGPEAPPAPSATTCTALAAYMNGLHDGHSYGCCSVQPLTVSVCTAGGMELNTLCSQTYGNQNAVQRLWAALAPGYTCNLAAEVITSCGYSNAWGTVGCQDKPLPSPPPSPSPPPPRTISYIDFPKSCYPGNSAANGGVGSSGTQLQAFSYIAAVAKASNSFTITITPNKACNPELTGTYQCCVTAFKKVEFVVYDTCRGAVESVTSPGPSKPLNPAYLDLSWPVVTPAGQPPSVLVAKLTGLSTSGQSTSFTVTLKNNSVCNTPAKFLYNDAFWYAAFGDGETGRLDACCGTSTI